MIVGLASTSKTFAKSKDIKYGVNTQLRHLVIQGLSTVDRLKFWNYRAQFSKYRRRYRGLYYSILESHYSLQHEIKGKKQAAIEQNIQDI